MAIIDWPRTLCPMETTIEVMSRTIVGPPVVSGSQQAVASSAGVWRVTFNGVPVQTDARILAWRALEVQIEGRSNPICVPLRGRSGLAPIDGGHLLSTSVPHDDDMPFDDGTEYYEALAGIVTTGGTYGSTSISISAAGIGTLLPGMMFSVGCRLYRIRSAALAGGIWAAVIWPPLREPVAAGALCDFSELVCKMRLATDTEMTTALTQGRRGVASVSFIEDVR